MLRTVIKTVFRLTRSCKRQCCRCPGATMLRSTQVANLQNGTKIATDELESPLACMSLAVTAGSRYETVHTNGLTHMIEHMAFKGFKSMNKQKLENAVIKMGAKMTVRTSREMQVFSVTLPSQHAATAVDKLFKIVTDLDINDVEVNQEKDNICLELQDADANPKQVVFDYLHATAFQGTPLAQRVIGTSDNIARFDANLINNYICEHYQPYRFVLATSGQVSHEKIMKHVEPGFGALAAQPFYAPESGSNRFTGSQVLFRDDSMPFCHAAIAFEAPGFNSSQYYTMLLMKYIVGSWDRSQGGGSRNAPLVARAFAVANLCERYQSFYIAYRDIGLWGVYFVADKWKLDEVVGHIQEQWMQLCTMVQATDIVRARNLLQLKLARRYASVVSSSYDISKQMLYTSKIKSLQDVSKKLTKIDEKTVRTLADKVLYDRCPAVAVVGPSETMPDYNRIRSGQWWLRL